MNPLQNRRQFLRTSSAIVAGAGIAVSFGDRPLFSAEQAPLFKISLAQWSLHKALQGGKLDNLDFAKTAKQDFDIDAVEYVNQFFKDKAKNSEYLADLKKRAADAGVVSVLIMCDGEGDLGDSNNAKRTAAIENHYKWIEAAKFLGCHSIRVDAKSDAKKSEDAQAELAADGLRRLTEFGNKHQISVIVENHGGLSSNGEWLAKVMKLVNLPGCGTLPDFGNFGTYDRYKGTTELMPFAKGVSAKSYDFDQEGNETKIDFRKMLKIVLDAGYHGYVGIEYEGNRMSEYDGIKATKTLLEKVRAEMTKV